MITFSIEQIDNGFLVKGDMGWYENSSGEYEEDFTIFAHSIPDAFAIIANKCDKMSEDELNKPPSADEYQEPLPF